MVEIKLSDRYVEYSLTIYDKFTLLRGDTASGKTTLYELFEHYQLNPMTVKCGGYKDLSTLPVLDNYQEYMDHLTNHHKRVHIMDENHPFFHIHGFEQILKSSDNYFIIINRDNLFRNLPIHLRSIVKLVSSGRYHTFKPFYTVPTDIKPFSLCICEDSVSGYKFLSQFFNNTVTCEGKDNIAKKLKNSNEPVLLAYDVSGIGTTYDDLYTKCRQYKHDVTHLTWESFEGYIIDNTVYKNAPRNDYDCSYNSYEDYAELVLCDALKSYPGIHYAKGKLPQCLRRTRCTSCDKTASCPYVMYGDNALLGDPVKKILDHYKDTPEKETGTLSHELIERVWSQMPEVIKPRYGSTKEEIATNYYKEYSYLFE